MTDEAPPPPLLRRRSVRLGLLAAIIVALWLAGWTSGLHEELTPEKVRDIVETAGALGIAVFCFLFVVGQVVQLPGLLFVAAAIFCWGPWQGAAIASAAATVAVVANFALVRRVGGDLKDSRRRYIRAILARIHRTPLLTMVVARLVFLTSPQLSIVLALSGVRHRDHALASFIGMTPMVFGWALLFELGYENLGWS